MTRSSPAVVFFLLWAILATSIHGSPSLSVVSLHQKGHAGITDYLTYLEKADPSSKWIELGNYLLILSETNFSPPNSVPLDAPLNSKLSIWLHPALVNASRHIQPFASPNMDFRSNLEASGARVHIIDDVVLHPRFIILSLPTSTPITTPCKDLIRNSFPLFEHPNCQPLLPFIQNQILFRDPDNQPVYKGSEFRVAQRERLLSQDNETKLLTADIKDFIDQVDETRWFSDVEQLAQWNRQASGPQIHLAVEFLLDRLNSLHLDQVYEEHFDLNGGGQASNVIGKLIFQQNESFGDDVGKIYVFGAHYDSTSSRDGKNLPTAPGAEDNASGTAVVLELARLFSQYFRDKGERLGNSEFWFILFGAEEIGLIGSQEHVKRLTDDEKKRLELVSVLDMVSYDASPATFNILLEAKKTPLFDLFFDVVNLFPEEERQRIKFSTSTHPFGSDHVPYIEKNLPALLIIDNDWDRYPDYHRTTDTPDNVLPEMAREVIRITAGATALLSLGVTELGAPAEESSASSLCSYFFCRA